MENYSPGYRRLTDFLISPLSPNPQFSTFPSSLQEAYIKETTRSSEWGFSSPWWSEQDSQNIGIPRMDLDMK